MKYVIMFTSTPELDSAVPEERAQEVYGRIYQWFADNEAKISDGGAELQPVSTATTVKAGSNGPVVADGRSRRRRRSSEDSACSTSPTSTRRSRSSARGRCSTCPAPRSRSDRWSSTTASSSSDMAVPASSPRGADAPRGAWERGGPARVLGRSRSRRRGIRSARRSPRTDRARGVGAHHRGADGVVPQLRSRRGVRRRRRPRGTARVACAASRSNPARGSCRRRVTTRWTGCGASECCVTRWHCSSLRLNRPTARLSRMSASPCCSDAVTRPSPPSRSSR